MKVLTSRERTIKMHYCEEEARKTVIEAVGALVEKGLVARTWGNVSARISDDKFVITPSGKGYENMQPSDLVVVSIADLSYDGDVKPSSEKGIHAEVYRQKSDAGFIIHTHQTFASAISVAGRDFDFAPCAAYGLPGTKTLIKGVSQSLAENPGKAAFLLQKHGTLCFGPDFESAFETCINLEVKSKSAFADAVGCVPASDEAFFDLVVKKASNLKPYLDDFSQFFGTGVSLKNGFEELCAGDEQQAKEMVLGKNCAAALFAIQTNGKPLGCFDAALQHFVYKKKYSKLKNK